MRKITKHIIHCSDSDFGDAQVLRHWHHSRGFKDVGYHFIIRQDGEIECGRMINEIGAHCAKHNRDSIGTCLIGVNQFTKAQYRSLKRLHESLKSQFKLIKAYPHNVFNEHKTCPNFNVEDVLS